MRSKCSRRSTAREPVDSLGRIKQIIGYYGATTDIDWTTFDTPKNVTLPEVVPGTSRPKIFYQYNRNRQITQAKEELRLYDGSLHPDGSLVKTYHYDPYGRVIKYGLGPEGMIDSHMRRTTFTPFNLPEKEIDFLGNVTFTEYDERMLIRSITRGWGTSPQSRREIVYDKSAQPIGFIDGLGYKTVNERDAFGRPHIIRDPDGNETEIEYDAVGRVILRRLYGLHPETSVKVRWAEVEFKYDALGRFIERLNHLFTPGVPGSDTLLRTQFFYDPSNRIENIIDPTGGTLHYNYDGRNRLKSLQDPGGSETKWRYDDITHTITIIDNDIGTDESGNTVSQAFQNIVRFDSRGLAIAETDSLGNITSRGFDSRKLLTHYKDANGQEFFADYDAYGQPTIYRTKFSDHQIETQMVYDSNGRIKSITSPIGGKTIWNYDVLNRIISIDRSDNIITFMYDKNDNLLFQNDANGIVLTLNYSPTGLLMKSQSDTSHFSHAWSSIVYTVSHIYVRLQVYARLTEYCYGKK